MSFWPRLRIRRRISGMLCVVGLVLTLQPPARPQQTLAKPPLNTPEPARKGLKQAYILLQNQQFAAAEVQIRARLAAAPDDADAAFLLGYVLLRQQHTLESLQAYTAAARLRPPSADDFVNIASNYIILKDFSDAKHWLTVATQTSPNHANAWYLLGRTDFNLDLPDAALRDFLNCLRIDPTNLKALYNEGLALEHLHRPAEAIAAYKQAIALETTSPHHDSQPYLDLGSLLLQQANPSDAITYLQAAVRLAPLNPFAHQQLALCLEALNRHEEAAAEMLLCAQQAPNAQGPPFFLGRIYKRLGREAEAKQQFARAAQLAGTHSAADVPNIERPE